MPHAKKLTDVEQFYFDQNYNILPLPTLAEKLDRTEKFVQKLVEKKVYERAAEITRAPEPTATPEVKAPPSLAFNNLVGRQKNPDGTPKKNPAVVMTEAASMVADQHLQSGNTGGMSPRLAQSVFRMRDE